MHITVEHLFRKRKKEKRETVGTLLPEIPSEKVMIEDIMILIKRLYRI